MQWSGVCMSPARVQHRVPVPVQGHICTNTNCLCEFFNMLTKEIFQLINSDRFSWKKSSIPYCRRRRGSVEVRMLASQNNVVSLNGTGKGKLTVWGCRFIYRKRYERFPVIWLAPELGWKDTESFFKAEINQLHSAYIYYLPAHIPRTGLAFALSCYSH